MERSDDIALHLNEALTGRYRVERAIGAGGMATVYLARDLKHERQVAIKVLSHDISESLGSARFLREIRIAAQLQHPHILGLIDSGSIQGTLFYVMPFVDGESLRDRLENGSPLSAAEAVPLLREIADALSYAHARGVVHRDIKPENVMISGRHALVVDFGVAKALEDAREGERLTTVGIALGTLVYMAPEQAAAEPDIDHRADIYAFGIMAYELLAGRPPFTGMSQQQIVMAHMTRTPVPLGDVRPDVPAALAQTIMRCLEKEPAKRWQSADELFAALEPQTTSSENVTLLIPKTVSAKSSRTKWLPGIVAVTIAIAALAVVNVRPDTAHTFSVGASEQFTTDDGLEIQPAISPDGKLIAYAAGNSQRMRIFIRPRAGGRTISLSDDSSSVELQPRWSPDGESLLFLSKNSAYVSPQFGGTKRLVIAGGEGDASVRAATWSPDGREIAFVRHDSLLIQPLSEDRQRLVSTYTSLHSCTWSPTAKWIACVSGNPNAQVPGLEFGNLAPSAVVLFAVEGGAGVLLTDVEKAHQSPVWSRDGSTLYVVSNVNGPRDIYAFPIGRTGHVNGDRRRVTTGLNAQSFSISADERLLVYSIYSAKANIWAAAIPRGAAEESPKLTAITSGSQVIEILQASPDGRSILFDSDISGTSQIYRIPSSGGSVERLTDDSLAKFAPDISRDGRELIYHAFGSDGHRRIYLKNLVDNTVQALPVNLSELRTPLWSPDGSAIATWNRLVDAGTVYVVRRDAKGAWERDPKALAAGSLPTWSPDGARVAFSSRDGSIQSVAASGGAERNLYTPSQSPEAVNVLNCKWSNMLDVIWAKGFDRAGHGGIWKLTVHDGTMHRMLRLDDPARPSDRGDFAITNERVYFTIDDRQSDVWTATLKH